jgi:RecA-family ATPase
MLREQLAAKVQPKRKLEFLNWQAFCDLAAQADDAQWLVENLITRGGMHFITAPPGGGKSWIAVDLVRACNDGSNWMGCLPVTKCNILYINEEMGIGRFFQRFFKLSPGACENVHIMQKQMVKLDNAEHMADIVQYVKDHDIAIVILDTFVRVHGYDENSNTDMAKLYDRMKGINESGAAIIALHHHKKGIHAGPVAHEAMRGAGEIAAQADLVATVENKDGIYTMKTTKQRHIGEEDFVEVSYKIVTNEDGSIVLQPCVGGAEAEREQQYIERVLNALDQNDKMSGNALAAVIGNNKQVALKFLDSMRDMGLIRKVDPAYARSPWVKAG